MARHLPSQGARGWPGLRGRGPTARNCPPCFPLTCSLSFWFDSASYFQGGGEKRFLQVFGPCLNLDRQGPNPSSFTHPFEDVRKGTCRWLAGVQAGWCPLSGLREGRRGFCRKCTGQSPRACWNSPWCGGPQGARPAACSSPLEEAEGSAWRTALLPTPAALGPSHLPQAGAPPQKSTVVPWSPSDCRAFPSCLVIGHYRWVLSAHPFANSFLFLILAISVEVTSSATTISSPVLPQRPPPHFPALAGLSCRQWAAHESYEGKASCLMFISSASVSRVAVVTGRPREDR